MAVTFAWRSDTSTGQAWYATGHADPYITRIGTLAIYESSTSSAIGSFNWRIPTTGNIDFSGTLNIEYGGPMSVLYRWAPTYNGSPPADQTIFNLVGPRIGRNPGISIYHRSSGQIQARIYDNAGSLAYNAFLVSALSATSGQFIDHFFTFRGDTTSSDLAFYQDGVLQTTVALAINIDGMTNTTINTLSLGDGTVAIASRSYFNEMVVWNSIEDPTSINTVTPGGVTTTADTLDGSSRTGWVDVSQFKGLVSSDPGVSNVLSGTGYTIDGLSLTGTYSPPVSTDPGIANVLSGTGYTINDVSLTGVLVAGGTYTDPGIANVRLDTSYIFNDATLTGTLTVPTPVSGTSTTINIPNIKEQIRYVLDTNNTTTSSVHDLSASMNKRVQKILTLNPENMVPQASLMPSVCIYTESKSIEPKTIAVNQVNAKRETRILFNIVGMVWNQNFAGNIFNDPADDDCERLMENIEKVLRHYHDLASVVKWQFPQDVTYHNAAFDEETHFRVGIMSLEATVYY